MIATVRITYDEQASRPIKVGIVSDVQGRYTHLSVEDAIELRETLARAIVTALRNQPNEPVVPTVIFGVPEDMMDSARRLVGWDAEAGDE